MIHVKIKVSYYRTTHIIGRKCKISISSDALNVRKYLDRMELTEIVVFQFTQFQKIEAT